MTIRSLKKLDFEKKNRMEIMSWNIDTEMENY